MKKISLRRIVVPALSLICLAFVFGAYVMFKTPKANAQELYNVNFSSLEEGMNGDEIFASTGLAGINRSVVFTTPNYIETTYSFYDNGCQQAYAYQDTNRGVPSTDTSKTYTLDMIYADFGYVADSTIAFFGPTGDYNSVLILRPDGTSQVNNYGAEQYLALVSAVRHSVSGWWNVRLTFQGTGGYVMPVFYMNSNNYSAANTEMNTGLRIAEYKVTEGENVIYDFEVPVGLTGNDAIFGACGFAGFAETAVTKAGYGGSDMAIKATYEFYDNGWQTADFYSDTNRVNVLMEEGKQYSINMNIQPIGSYNQLIAIFDQLDPNNGWARVTEQQAIMKNDGTLSFEEYGEEKYYDLEKSSYKKVGDSYLFNAVVNGTGNRFMLLIRMLSSDYAAANEAHDTGFILRSFSISQIEEEQQPEGPEEKLLYKTSYTKLVEGMNSDGIFGETGLAGGDNTAVFTTPNYVETIYSFYDNGCQTVSVYQDTNRGVPSTDASKTYTLDMIYADFGYIADTTLALLGPTGDYNSVLILRPDGSSQVNNYGAEQYVTLVSAVRHPVSGWWNIRLTFQGTGGYFMPVFYMNSNNYSAANTEMNTGLRIAEYKVTEGENVIYDFEVPVGLTGNDAIFGACGFAGFAETAVTKAGLGGSDIAIKHTYEFYDNGWQTVDFYSDTNRVNVLMEEGKKYSVKMDIQPIGSNDLLIAIFDQLDPDNGWAKVTEQQAIMKSDGTLSFEEYGEEKYYDLEKSSYEKVGDRFVFNAVINGTGNRFMLLVRMLTTDYAAANEAHDTGFILRAFSIGVYEENTEPENPIDLGGEYQVVYSQNFNSTDPSTNGSDAMFHAVGFAGVTEGSLTIDQTGINGTQAIKAVYNFFVEAGGDGWQKSSMYLDSSRTNNTVGGKIYKFTMDLKPFGTWDSLVVGFEYPSYARDYIYIKNDGSTLLDKNPVGKIIDYTVTANEGVYTLTAYFYGTDGYIFNLFNMYTKDSNTANAEETGFMLDNYSFARQKSAEKPGLNKKAAMFNLATDEKLVMAATFSSVDKVEINGNAIASSAYEYEDNFLTIYKAAFANLPEGAYTVKATCGDESDEMMLMVVDVAMGVSYENDFAGMPNLNGDQNGKDDFFRNSYMDPGVYYLWTMGENEGRYLKLACDYASESVAQLFQTNPQNGRLNYINKDKLHSVSVDFKPENTSFLAITGRVFDNGADTLYFYMELDLAAGKRLDEGQQSAYASWDITPKADGWYTVTVTFIYSGEQYSDTSSMYIMFGATPVEGSAWYMDNFMVKSELVPSIVNGKSNYDVASAEMPYVLVDLCRTFEISSITVGNTILEEGDYEASVTPVGYTRIDLAKSFCEAYEVGDEFTLNIMTTKGNTLTYTITCIDTTPVLPTEAVVLDKAAGESAFAEVDLKGYTVASIKCGDTTLVGTEYNYVEGNGTIEFKYSYLKTLEVGNYVFEVTTTSGAKGTFTLALEDSTPVISAIEDYDKTSGQDLVFDVDLKGKELQGLYLDDVALEASAYTYANGKMTIHAATLEGIEAGEHEIKVYGSAVATQTFEIKDVPPVFTGEYTIEQGMNIEISCDIFGKDIVSITVDGLELRNGEYEFANGKLLIDKEVFMEIALGDRKIVLVTTGGKAEITVHVVAAGEGNTESESGAKKGCFGSIGGTIAILSTLSVLASALIIKKKED